MTPMLRGILISLALVTAAAAQLLESPNPAYSTDIRMQQDREYPHAGIRLAVPLGFSYQELLSGADQVMAARRVEGRLASQSVSLSAYLVPAQTTAVDFLTQIRQSMEKDLAVSRLKVLQQVEIPIGDRTARAEQRSYRYRGIDTLSWSLCLVRSIEGSPQAGEAGAPASAPSSRLAYLLTLELAAKYKQKLQDTFDAITRTLMLTEIRRPVDLPITLEGPLLKDFEKGYGFRTPVGWIGGQDHLGLFTEQTDYLLGGLPCPSVQAVCTIVDDTLTAQACGEKAIQYQKDHGANVEILSQGPAKLAGKDGYQFVIRKNRRPATQPTTQPVTQSASAPRPGSPTLEVHRLLCVPHHKKHKLRSYVLIVSCKQVTVEQIVALADTLAGGFQLIPIPEEEEE